MTRKILSIILVSVLAFTLSACSKDEEKTANKAGDTMSLEEIASKLYEGIDELPEVENIKLKDELFTAFTFIEPIKDAKALASEGVMSSIAHSVVLLRLPEGADVESVRKEIEEKADPVKWVCVGAEKKTVVANGNTVLLVMSFENITDKVVNNFNKLWE